MTLLYIGLALWGLGHFFKRLLPGLRAAMGPAGKGVSAAISLAGLVLMVIGYRHTAATVIYQLPGWAVHLNNLLMLLAVILLGIGHSKGRMRSWLRHPMLSAVVVWAVAHLLVNGDAPSLVLFGGLGAWALVEMVVISTLDGPWQRPVPGPLKGDFRLLLISAVVFVVIVALHSWLGPSPFGVHA